MIILTCALKGGIKPETEAAIVQHWTDVWAVNYIDPDDQHRYGEILARYWDAGEDFAVVEPDVVIREDVVDAFLICPEPYCCFPYQWLTHVGPALGCTRFRKQFLEAHPDAMRNVLRQNISWRQLDVVLMRHELARNGVQPHVHLPEVEHLNEKKRLLPDASRTPMMEVPLR